MIRLLYTSTSRIQQSDSRQPLIEILNSSIRNNRQQGVTGLLMHGCGMFLQVLEGYDEQVFTLYVRLLNDPRHTDCRVVLVTQIDKRSFPEWAMAAMNVSDSAFQKIQELLSQRDVSVEEKLLAMIMKHFMKG